jgi:hypothetical protein
MSAGDGPEVEIADRAAGVTAELQVHQPLGVRYLHRVALDSDEFASGQDISYLQLAYAALSVSAGDFASVHPRLLYRIILVHFAMHLVRYHDAHRV